MKMSGMGGVVWVLLFVGGLNWGLIGFFDYNLIGSVFGDGNFTRVIYALIGIAAIWSLITMFSSKESSSKESGGGDSSMSGQKPM